MLRLSAIARSATALIPIVGICVASLGVAPLCHAAAKSNGTATVTPLRISIPAAGTDAPIIALGLTGAGNLDTPHNFVQAGWYDYGPVPGQAGSAVIDGHVDNGGFSPTVNGIFKNL